MTLNINFAKNKGWNSPAAPAFTAIGSVGTAGQMAAGHVLTAASFPSAAVGANLSWYNLAANESDASGNGRTLTPIGSPTYSGTDILGNTGCLTLNGSSQFVKITNSFFNPGDNDWFAAGWFYSSNWVTPTGGPSLFSQWDSGIKSFYIQNDQASLYLYLSTTGSDVITVRFPLTITTGWHHIALKYIASTNTIYLYVNGKQFSQYTLSSSLYGSGTGTLMIGASDSVTPGNFWNGEISNFIFARYAFTDNDIAKIYARKYSHNQNISPVSQTWIMKAQNGGQTRELLDNIVDMQANDLYYDLSGEASTTQVSLRLANIY